MLDPGEACDGTKLGSIKACTDYADSFSGGTLKSAHPHASLTQQDARKPKCGNNFIDVGEACDGTKLGNI